MQFGHPEFLWGLLAISIPIAIHLIQLRRPYRIRFTNTEFIREVELTTVRRRQVEELLVLLARLFAISLLVLAFSQPFLPSARLNEQHHAGRIEVLVDNSGSMQAAGASQAQLLQEAVTSASALSKSYGLGASFALSGRHKRALKAAALADELNQMRVGQPPLGWGAAFGPAASAREDAAPLYVFSDFQRSEVAHQNLQKTAAGRQVILVPQVGPPVGNVYVDSVWLNDAFVRVKTNIALHMRLRNGGAKPVADCPVKVLLGGLQVATLQLSVGPQQTAEVTVQLQVPDARLAQGRVEVTDAPVTFDNIFYFTLQPASTIGVVEIGSEPVTQAVYEREALFHYSFSRPERVNYSALQQANLVLLREVPRVETGLREALAGVVRRGGSVVVVPAGRGADQASYQALLRALGAGEARWEPATTGNLPPRQEVALPNPRDPFFRDVFGVQPRQVALPQAAAVLRPGGGGTDILRLRDGEAYLAAYASTSGPGRSYLFAAPFSAEYSDFTTNSLFVPVLYRLAMTSYRADQLPAYRLSAGALSLTPPATTSPVAEEAASYRLVRDSLSFRPAQRLLGGQLRLEVPVGLSAPGFYELRRGDKVITTLAFNADPRESELAAYSAAELRQLLGPNVQVLEGGARPEVLARLGAEQAGQPLWRYCLLLALAALLAEELLLRFGRARQVGAAPVAAV